MAWQEISLQIHGAGKVRTAIRWKFFRWLKFCFTYTSTTLKAWNEHADFCRKHRRNDFLPYTQKNVRTIMKTKRNNLKLLPFVSVRVLPIDACLIVIRHDRPICVLYDIVPASDGVFFWFVLFFWSRFPLQNHWTTEGKQPRRISG